MRALIAGALLLAAPPALAAAPEEPAGEPGERILIAGTGVTLSRLTHPAHDAVRPRFSPDGSRLAYVRRAGEPAERGAGSSLGEEIWIVDREGRSPRRRVGASDLEPLVGRKPGYSLHDIAWEAVGRRIAFTWYDGSGWARILVSDPDGSLVLLPPPQGSDRWEERESYLLSATQFVWDRGGTSGVLVAWDDDCGRLFQVRIPARGDGGEPPVEIPLPPGCRPAIVESAGYWLYRSREHDFAQRLGIVDRKGSVIESRVFRTESNVYARWGARDGASRPPVLGWWDDREAGRTVFFVWKRGEVVVWGREPCARGCPEPILLSERGIHFLDGAGSGGRLMLLPAPGETPREVVPSGVSALQAAPGGRDLVAVITGPEGGRAGLWRVEDPR